MKTIRILILTVFAFTALICHAQITDSGWFATPDSGLQSTPPDNISQDATPHVQSMPHGTPLGFNLTTNNPDPTAVAETITPEIQALANGLQNDWSQIYSYVHDHIRYVHYFGSMKGAQLTLLEKSGNDFDQCALLMALLRAAGYTNSTYQFGWMGIPIDDPVTGNDLHHWFQLSFSNTNWSYTSNYVQRFFNNRGYPYIYANGTNNIVYQRVWVNFVGGGMNLLLDPAFKTYQTVPGISLTNAMGFSSNAVMSAAGGTATSTYVTNLNANSLDSTLTGYTANLLSNLQNNYPNASVEQILGGQDIVPGLNIGLNFNTYTLTVGGHSSGTTTWTHEPTNLMSSFKITFAKTNYFCWMPQLLGQRLSLIFGTTGQATLWQDDTLLASNTASGTSRTTNVVVAVRHPVGVWNFANGTVTLNNVFDQVVTNSYQRTNSMYALIYAFQPDWYWLQERQNQLDMYRLQGLGDTSRQVVTEGLNIMGLNWTVQCEKMTEMSAAQAGILPAYWHRFGRMAQENGNGYYVDVYMQLSAYASKGGADSSNIAKEQRFFDVTSYFQSALEHGIIEQLENTNIPAASTVKMLEIANANGQAVYLANSADWSTVRTKLINYTPAASNSIAAAVTAGYNILLPQNGSNHVASAGSWAGYGYAARLLTSTNETLTMSINGLYNGGYSGLYYSIVDPSYLGQYDDTQPTIYSRPGSLTPGAGTTIADPVDAADGTFQVEQTDLSLGQAEPKGITLSRYYNGTRRYSNLAGMSGGWIHNYYVNAASVAAPQAEWGGTTPAQAAPLLTATCAALGLYNGANPDPKNWMVTALIAKWGIDQLSHNSVSVVMGKDTVQFVQQPNGVYTPPANCNMTLTQSGGNFVLQQRHGNAFDFDSQGRLSTIADQYGNNLSLTYLSSTSSLPYQVSDWKGRTLTFNYTGGQLTSASDNSSPSRTISYSYSSTNTQADLTSFTDAEGKTTSYTYDSSHQITATIDAASRLVVSNVYDSFSHVALQYGQGDTNKTWQVFWSPWQTVEQDPAGGQTVMTYDDQSRLVASQDPLYNYTQLYYDGQNHVVTNISPIYETTIFVYDGNNNLIQSIDQLGFTNQFFYDSQFNLIRALDQRGNPTTFGYNAQFSLIGQTNGAGDFLSLTYNPDGTLATRTDAGGQTQYGYDTTYGQLNTITYPNSLGTESFVTSAQGDVTSHTDGNGNSTAFYYNNRRQLTNTVAPTNITMNVGYDSIGNVASETDARKNVTRKVWSATRQLLSTTMPTTPQGVPVVTNFYDSRDWLARTLDPLQNPTLFTNDAAGRLIAVTDPVLRTTQFTYDSDGHKTATVNAQNETNSQTFDARGDLTKSIDGAGHYFTKAYDATGNQIILTNRNHKKWQFQFDGANRLTNTITPLNYSSSVVFNHQGLVSSTKDQAGQASTLGYDAKGRLTSRSDTVGTTQYGYDGNNNRTSVSENGLTNSRAYDAYNRVSSYKDVYGNAIQYRYDANGNLTNLVYPGGKNVYYAYDALNRMTNVTDWAGRVSSVAYDLDSRVTSITRPNGTRRTIKYDAAGQGTNILEQMGNTLPIAIFTYGWTNSGSMAWEFAAPLPHSNSVPTRTMTYDDDNRLSTFNGSSVNNNADGDLTFGPLTNATSITYVYDARNRLLSAGGVTNIYDAANNRIAQMQGTNSTVFIVDPIAKLPQVLMRIKNGVTNYYIYGPGLLYQVTETATATNTLTYHYDFRGSTIALSADNGVVVDRIEYSLYGLMTYRAGSDDTPFLFNGRYGVQTDANGLLYMRSRYYNPFLCRFINPDPSGFSGGMNFYAYANGNPISYLDPFGLNSSSTGDGFWTWLSGVGQVFEGYGDAAVGTAKNLGMGGLHLFSWLLGNVEMTPENTYGLVAEIPSAAVHGAVNTWNGLNSTDSRTQGNAMGNALITATLIASPFAEGDTAPLLLTDDASVLIGNVPTGAAQRLIIYNADTGEVWVGGQGQFLHVEALQDAIQSGWRLTADNVNSQFIGGNATFSNGQLVKWDWVSGHLIGNPALQQEAEATMSSIAAGHP